MVTAGADEDGDEVQSSVSGAQERKHLLDAVTQRLDRNHRSRDYKAKTRQAVLPAC